MEIKTAYTDLIDRSVSGTQRKTLKSEGNVSGFKNLLKNRDQKKQTEDKGKDIQTVSEAALPYNNGTVSDPLKEEQSLGKQGELGVQSPGEDGSVTKDQLAGEENIALFGTIDPMSLFRSMEVNGQKGTGESADSGENMAGMIGASEKVSGFLLKGQDLMPKSDSVTGSEILNQGEEQISSLQQEGTEKSFENVMLGDAHKKAGISLSEDNGEDLKPSGSEKEDAGLQNMVDAIRSRIPQSSDGIHSSKQDIVTVSVNESNPQELEARLSEQILSQIRTGNQNLELQLEPHNLGKILLKISYHRDQVNVSIVCSESKTLKLISQSAGEIGSMLENNMERPFQVVVDKQQADYLDNQQHGRQEGGQNQHQNQQKGSDEHREDFLQKLRLGILDSDQEEYFGKII